jgi:uncharacterized membrane protein
MGKNKEKSFGSDFRHFFGRGLIVLLPTVLTLWIVVQAYRFVDANIAQPINGGVQRAVLFITPKALSEKRLPSWYTVSEDQIEQRREERRKSSLGPLSEPELRTRIRQTNFSDWWESRWYTRFSGLIVAILLIYLAGRVLGGFIGRRLYARLERLLARIPIFKQVYPHVKQIVDFLFGESQMKFSKVVIVEYPRAGIWTVGLLTGDSLRDIQTQVGVDIVSVFIPSSPTPFTGYTITVPREDAIEVPITIEEALRFVVSGGVLVPDRERSGPIGGNPVVSGLATGLGSGMMGDAPEAGKAIGRDDAGGAGGGAG